ncbi:MAG: nucleoside-diphosphate kinase [Elusimicrobiales bacterium]
MAMERTLVLIKPDGVARRLAGLTLDKLESSGMELVAAAVVRPSDSLARAHYREHEGKPFFNGIVNFLKGDLHPQSGGRVYAFVFKGEDAVTAIRHVVGATNPDEAAPGTVRGCFGKIRNGLMENVVHASSGAADAEREIALWFPNL